MKVITPKLLRQLSVAARNNPRLRRNHNLHPADHSRCHRLLNAIEPASYIRPHRHLDPEKDEGFILMGGALGVITFKDDGRVDATILLSAITGNRAVDITHATYHTAVSLEPGTVFYECKAGPYLPLMEEEKAPWAPEEGTPESETYLQRLQALFA